MYISIQSHESIFHLDGTYKTNFNNFPLLSFGRSNINRKYYLIFLSLVSKEETEDYIRLFEAFKYLCTAFNINCIVKFIMQDACQSESAAASISYPSTIILMCYFHLKKNVRNRLKVIKRKEFLQRLSNSKIRFLVTLLNYNLVEINWNLSKD